MNKKNLTFQILSLVMLLFLGNILKASSHREAPLISNDPLADNTDLYAFRSPENPEMITLIATYVPMQLPQGGPNYYTFGKNIRYEIHVDNDASISGDEITYRFTFDITNEDPTTFFNIRLGKQNQKATYTLERSLDGGKTFRTIVTNGIVPPNNIGPRSIEGGAGLNTSYNELFNKGITIATTGEKIFAGPTDDPFFVDLGGIFDLGDAPRQGGKPVDGLACYNVSALVIQVPIATLLKKDAPAVPTSILDSDYVIGVWASASRPAITTISNSAEPLYSGDWVQVSRLGMPLTNEAVIPIGDKDYWNSITPYDEIAETTLDKYFYNPELALYMDDDLFGGAVPGFAPLRIQKKSLGAFDFTNGADGLYGLKGNPALAGTALDDAVFGTLLLPGPGMPRSVDLWPAFHTGVPNVIPYQLATGKNGNPLAAGKPFVNNFLPNGGDMLRLNMAVPPTPRNDANFSSLGLIQAAVLGLTAAPYNTNSDLEFIPNMDGFPNGRRLEDDVTRIELQAVSGAVLAAIGLWYDDYDPATSASPVTKQLLNVITYTTGVEKNDKPFTSSFPYLAQPSSGTGDCSGEVVNPDVVITDPSYQVYVSSNTQQKIGVFNFNDDKQFSFSSFMNEGVDADGIYYDNKADVLYQLNRSANVINAYSNVKSSLASGNKPQLTATSTSDFTNGREIAVRGNRLVVTQDADASNGMVDKLIVYSITPNRIELVKSHVVNIALWGIEFDGDDLFAVVDVSDKIVRYDNFLSNAEGPITPSKTIAIEGMTRTHGLTYVREGDMMIMTDVAAATNATDGAFTIIKNFNTKSVDNVISLDEQIIVEGPMSLLGNPVDIAYDRLTNRIYVAERANNGGRFLGFDIPTVSGDYAPVLSQDFAGASAINLSNQRVTKVTQPTVSIFDPNFSKDILVSSRLNGAAEVPAVTTNAVGVATVTFNDTYTRATINASISGLSSNFMGAHIHRGNAGTNGPVVFNFTNVYSKGRISSTFDVTKEDVQTFINNGFYLNIHTANNPNGEIRGQLGVESAESFMTTLNGANEVPSTRTAAKGVASVIYTANTNVVEINILATDLTGPITGLHFHSGANGTNGGVVENLSTKVVGNTVIVKMQAGTYISDLRSGNIYVNVHTEAYPNGEIRGQLSKVNGLHFDAWMTGTQEVPAITNDAIGLIAGFINSTLDSISLQAVIDNPSGSLAAAHLHNAKLGVNGPVVLDLGTDILGKTIGNKAKVIDLNTINNLLAGQLYINAHTAANPSGEVRGQIYRVARDGYAYDVCQKQEVPSVTNAGDASGSGMFAFNRDYDEAHMMVVATELSTAFASAHIHNGKFGENGPVVLDIASFWANNGAFFYLSDTFQKELATLIQSGNAYVNIHTARNPNGELRGQITRTPECPFSSAVIDVAGSSFEINVFPNPVVSELVLNFEGDAKLYNNSQLELINIAGETLITKSVNSSSTTLDVTKYPSGVYLVKLTNQNYTKTIKITKI